MEYSAPETASNFRPNPWKLRAPFILVIFGMQLSTAFAFQRELSIWLTVAAIAVGALALWSVIDMAHALAHPRDYERRYAKRVARLGAVSSRRQIMMALLYPPIRVLWLILASGTILFYLDISNPGIFFEVGSHSVVDFDWLVADSVFAELFHGSADIGSSGVHFAANALARDLRIGMTFLVAVSAAIAVIAWVKTPFHLGYLFRKPAPVAGDRETFVKGAKRLLKGRRYSELTDKEREKIDQIVRSAQTTYNFPLFRLGKAPAFFRKRIVSLPGEAKLPRQSSSDHQSSKTEGKDQETQ